MEAGKITAERTIFELAELSGGWDRAGHSVEGDLKANWTCTDYERTVDFEAEEDCRGRWCSLYLSKDG